MIVYLDGIIIFSRNEEHLQHLEIIFKRRIETQEIQMQFSENANGIFGSSYFRKWHRVHAGQISSHQRDATA